jgi:SAM-dependent methyltransferase
MLFRRPILTTTSASASANSSRGGAISDLINLTWLRGHRAGRCPVCSNHGLHSLLLSIPSTSKPNELITFARCRRCDARFVMDFDPPPFTSEEVGEASQRFYFEQNAGLSFLARSLFVVAQAKVRSYLDVGCGFGFSLDMATRMFGWNASGIDPGPFAALGREMLDVSICDQPLAVDTNVGDAPYDAIVATEVIEHITQPQEFVRAVRSNLSDEGILVLSTPNGRYLESRAHDYALLPILSPGYHAILYTGEGLAGLLGDAGFSNVVVTDTESTLFAVASPSSKRRLQPNMPISRAKYALYLRSRFRSVQAGSALHIGFGQRLLRCLIDEASYDEALEIFHELREALNARLNIDLNHPLALADQLMQSALTFDEMPGKYPFCLAGLLYNRGIIARRHEDDAELASCYFVAARIAARKLLGMLSEIGSSDGETVELLTLAESALGLPNGREKNP